MSSTLVIGLLRGFLPIGLGYALVRYVSISSEPIRALLRYALLPAVLFHALMMPQLQQSRTFLIIGGTGVAMALAGVLVARQLGRRVLPSLTQSAASPALVVFALPLVALALGQRGAALTTVAVLFVAVALTLTFVELGEKGFGVLIREPWVLAALAALVFRLGGIPSQGVLRLLEPLVDAGWTLSLVYLGTRLHPFRGLEVPAAWLGAGVRLAVGLGVAYLAIQLFDVASSIEQGILLAGLAPTAPLSLALIRGGGEREDGRATVIASTVVAVAALVVWRAMLS